jgi:CubicO group peptidase (beta-lactamase class C family)
MNRALVTVTAAMALLAGCDSDSDSEPDAAAVRPATAACDPALERALRAWAQAGFSGSIAISTRGRIECVAAYGSADRDSGRPNTPKTVFSIGSITKSFTAAAILDLIDAGKLARSDRAGKLIPQLAGAAAGATVEQLLLHTSGLTGAHGEDHEPLDRDQAIAAIGELEQAFPHGSDVLYSNAGYTLLALIVEQVSGTSYRDYVASHILRPAGNRVAGGFWEGEPAVTGPRAVGYLEDGSAGELGGFAGPYWAVEGNGGLAMTMRDLATWTHALFTGEIVSPRAVKAITTRGVETGKGQSESPGWVAYDASVFGQPVFASAGGGGDIGHDAIVAWLPESERAIAIASNTPDISGEQLMSAIGPALAAGEPLPGPKRPVKVGAGGLKGYAGTYDLPSGGSFEVAARDDELAVSAEAADAITALFPIPDGVSAEDVAAHEDAVEALLAGESEEGRKERKGLEQSLGPIDDVELDGSMVADGELRTYVTVTSGNASLRLWYALNEAGGVRAAQGPTEPPTLLLVAAGRDTFRPDDPTGASPPLAVTFHGRRMTVTGPDGAISARRADG